MSKRNIKLESFASLPRSIKAMATAWALIANFGLIACQESTVSAPFKQNTPSPLNTSEKVTKNTLPTDIGIEIRKLVDLREDRSNLDEFKNSINKYGITISIPESYFSDDLDIKYSVNAESLNPGFLTVDKNQAEFQGGRFQILNVLNPWKNNDLAAITLTYKVYFRDELLGIYSATLIPDLILKNDSTTAIVTAQSIGLISGKYQFGVLYFENGTILQTRGANISIVTDKLISERGTIETFSEKETEKIPEMGQIGVSGGHLAISANRAWGHLQIFMRGTRGGTGYEQTLLPPVAPKGPTGESSVIVNDCFTDEFLSGGVGGGRCSLTCAKNPANGLPGEPGLKGLPGGKGMTGGASGSFELILVKPDLDFRYLITNKAGKGGPGGAGGKGGQGGPGGDPGDNAFNLCRPASPGPQGLQGTTQGDPGPEGSEGQTESNHVEILNLNAARGE